MPPVHDTNAPGGVFIHDLNELNEKDPELADVLRGIQEAEELRISPLLSSSEGFSADISYVGTHMTEILMQNDSRGKSKIFDTAKRLEVKGMKEQKVWNVNPKAEMLSNGIILKGSFYFS